MRMLLIICGLSGSTVFFTHYLINSTIFEKKIIVCYDFLCKFEIFFILRKAEQDMIKKDY